MVNWSKEWKTSAKTQFTKSVTDACRVLDGEKYVIKKNRFSVGSLMLLSALYSPQFLTKIKTEN